MNFRGKMRIGIRKSKFKNTLSFDINLSCSISTTNDPLNYINGTYRDRHKDVLGACTAEKTGFRMDYIVRADLGLGEFDGSSGIRVARTLNLAACFSTICQYFHRSSEASYEYRELCARFKSRGHFCLSNSDCQKMLHFNSYVFIMWICAVVLLNIVNTFSNV